MTNKINFNSWLSKYKPTKREIVNLIVAFMISKTTIHIDEAYINIGLSLFNQQTIQIEEVKSERFGKNNQFI